MQSSSITAGKHTSNHTRRQSLSDKKTEKYGTFPLRLQEFSGERLGRVNIVTAKLLTGNFQPLV
eukprot:scaffold30167_cov343-Skeletonema_menzelii.AAC.1